MSESQRPVRNVGRVNYTEPGDSPDLSALEFSAEAPCDSSGNSVSEGSSLFSSPNSSVVEEEAIAMATARANQLIAEMEAIFFQLGEIAEDITERLDTMSTSELNSCSSEIKELRVALVKANQELNLVSNGRDYDKRAKEELALSKDVLNQVKTKFSTQELSREKADEIRQQEQMRMEQMKFNSKIAAFQRSKNEIQTMFVALNDRYSAPVIDLSRDEMLKRHKDVSALSSEFDVFRERVDRLMNQTDLVFNDKEKIIEYVVDLLGKLTKSKEVYEKRSYEDLVTNDLTADKLKLAESIKIDVGKYGGVLGKGDDFYTFKSKFLKAYGNYPQQLLVQYLKNNHLDGKAKDCVGSLDDLENIWVRLKNNFGNTDEMLKHHFQRLNKLGQMSKRKTYTAKKHYLQTVINCMQDAIDVATEHDLTGEVHYGSQLGSIVALLENYLQSAWWKIVAVESVRKPNRWLRMIVFLEAQLVIIQTRANETESADPNSTNDREPGSREGRDNNNNNNNGGRGGGRGERVNHTDREACALCDEVHPSPNKEFIKCKKFLQMTPNQRGELVRRKHKCLQCLDITARWNEEQHIQNCPVQWACPNNSHERFDRKLHFLLCGPHAGEEANVALFERFKTEVLQAEWQRRVVRTLLVRTRTFHMGNVAPNDEICADFAAQLDVGFGHSGF